jgi:hypothetical protein
MDSSKQTVERRRIERFPAPQGLFAVLGARHLKLGTILDINTIGLTWRYVDKEKLLSGMYWMDIYMSGSHFHLGQVPVETISDLELVHGRPYWPITIRRCGVQFGELTPIQKSELQSFVQRHTVKEGG